MINFDLKGNNIKQTIFIITGKISGGKTTFLSELVSRLQVHNLTISGFFAKKNATKKYGQSYDISFNGTGESLPLLSEKQVQGWNKIANFYFNPEALRRGNEVLNVPQILNKDLIVIDEIGIFELDGSIWADAVSRLIEKHVRTMILVVRDSLVEKVIKRWNMKDPVIIDIEKMPVADAEKLIIAQF